MNTADLKNEKVLVLGLSTTGFAAAKFFARAGAKCFLSDSTPLTEENKEKAELLKEIGVETEFGGHTEEFMKGAKLCVLSPSIRPESDVLGMLEMYGIPHFSDLELAHRIKNEKTKIIAITGTNGKTTTTMLISHILNKKYSAPAVGNVGTSPLDYLCPNFSLPEEAYAKLDLEPDFLVCEASSYQLHYTKTFAPYAAVFCNLTPDHIDWHKGIENYFLDKAKMYKNMDENSHCILNYDDNRVKNITSRAKIHFFALEDTLGAQDAFIKDNKIFYGTEVIMDTDDVPIVGAHNLQNVMCAVIACKNAGLSTAEIVEGIKSFRAPEHRCEFITEKDGTAYYNDSKATNPEASIVAIGAFEGKKVSLIAGGRDKNTSLDEFCKLTKERIDKVVLIGEAAERFNTALLEAGFKNIVLTDTLEDAIQKAKEGKPDVVLFSPACASFDMFKNYEQRGEAFRDYVLSEKL